MVTGSIPDRDELLILIEIWQLIDKINDIFTIPTIIRHQEKITMIKIQSAIIGLSLFDILNRDFRFCISPAPHVPRRVTPQQMALILSQHNELTFCYFCLPSLQFFILYLIPILTSLKDWKLKVSNDFSMSFFSTCAVSMKWRMDFLKSGNVG